MFRLVKLLDRYSVSCNPPAYRLKNPNNSGGSVLEGSCHEVGAHRGVVTRKGESVSDLLSPFEIRLCMLQLVLVENTELWFAYSVEPWCVV